MAELKATPGDWTVLAAKVRAGRGAKRVFSVNGPPSDFMYLENEADAYLLAAAPELYAVCAEIREAFSYFSEWDLPVGFEDRLNAALAKARGDVEP